MGFNEQSGSSGGGGGGGGDASAANQVTANGYLASLDGKVTAVNTGAVVVASSALPSGAATSANQTTSDGRLATIASNTTNAGTPQLAAGTNTVGATFDLSNTFASSAFTRPADTTAYASGDLVANNTTAGSVTPISISIARANNAPFSIFRAGLRKSTSSTTNAQFRVHMFNALPTVTNGDNGVLLCTQSANYMGYFDIDMSQNAIFSDGAAGKGQPDSGSAMIAKPVSGAQTVYALIEARAAYTPGNAETFTLTLEGTQS